MALEAVQAIPGLGAAFSALEHALPTTAFIQFNDTLRQTAVLAGSTDFSKIQRAVENLSRSSVISQQNAQRLFADYAAGVNRIIVSISQYEALARRVSTIDPLNASQQTRFITQLAGSLGLYGTALTRAAATGKTTRESIQALEYVYNTMGLEAGNATAAIIRGQTGMDAAGRAAIEQAQQIAQLEKSMKDLNLEVGKVVVTVGKPIFAALTTDLGKLVLMTGTFMTGWGLLRSAVRTFGGVGGAGAATSAGAGSLVTRLGSVTMTAGSVVLAGAAVAGLGTALTDLRAKYRSQTGSERESLAAAEAQGAAVYSAGSAAAKSGDITALYESMSWLGKNAALLRQQAEDPRHSIHGRVDAKFLAGDFTQLLGTLKSLFDSLGGEKARLSQASREAKQRAFDEAEVERIRLHKEQTTAVRGDITTVAGGYAGDAVKGIQLEALASRRALVEQNIASGLEGPSALIAIIKETNDILKSKLDDIAAKEQQRLDEQGSLTESQKNIYEAFRNETKQAMLQNTQTIRRSYMEQMIGGAIGLPSGSFTTPGMPSDKFKYGSGYIEMSGAAGFQELSSKAIRSRERATPYGKATEEFNLIAGLAGGLSQPSVREGLGVKGAAVRPLDKTTFESKLDKLISAVERQTGALKGLTVQLTSPN